MAGRGGNRRPTWGSGRGERGGIRKLNPGRLGSAGERERGGSGRGRRGACTGVADVARRGRDVGAAAVSAVVATLGRAAGGRGRPRQVGPTCRRPGVRGEAGGRLARLSWAGRGPAGGGGEKGGMGRRPIQRKERKEKKEKRKKKEKGFFLGLKLHVLNFNWLKLFREL